MCLAQGSQRSDAGEARTRGPSVSSQALYHWATALFKILPSIKNLNLDEFNFLQKQKWLNHKSIYRGTQKDHLYLPSFLFLLERVTFNGGVSFSSDAGSTILLLITCKNNQRILQECSWIIEFIKKLRKEIKCEACRAFYLFFATS